MFNKIMLFLSSYIPLYILMIGKNILERTTIDGKFKHISSNIILFDGINDYAIAILTVLLVISFIYLYVKVKNVKMEKHYKVISFEDETVNYFFNYISIYLISCMGLSLNRITDVFIIIFMMFLVGYIYISNNIIYLNPVINIMGYKVYNSKLEALSTGEIINSIVLFKRNMEFKCEIEVIGTEKNNFIIAKTTNKRGGDVQDVKEKVKQDYLKGMKQKEISSKYDISLNTLKSWIRRYNWASEKKKGAPINKRGAPFSNKNSVGHGAPKENKNAEKFGFFSKYLPEETRELIQEISIKDKFDILWEQITIQYAAIIRAQKIMYVKDKEEMVKELKK
ncbi:terminase gpP N-terminus-related DNA-binding protein, partial [Clostridioides difficile]